MAKNKRAPQKIRGTEWKSYIRSVKHVMVAEEFMLKAVDLIILCSVAFVKVKEL